MIEVIKSKFMFSKISTLPPKNEGIDWLGAHPGSNLEVPVCIMSNVGKLLHPHQVHWSDCLPSLVPVVPGTIINIHAPTNNLQAKFIWLFSLHQSYN